MKVRSVKQILCMLLTAVLLMTLCPLTVSAATLKLNYSSISLTKGCYATLKTNNSSAKVTWSTSNKSIATVSSKGRVYGKSAGTCYITAKVGTATAKCKVKVVNGKLTLSQSTVNLEEGDSTYVTVTAKGSHSLGVVHGDKTIAKGGWVKNSWNGDKVKLKITGVSGGKTTIKVRMSKYPEIYKTITVNVNASEQEIEENEEDPVTSVILTGTSSVNVEKDKTAVFEIYSDNTSKTTVTSSDTSVATVSSPSWTSEGNGTVTVKGVKNGTATITIAASDNTSLRRSVLVTVTSDGYYAVSQGIVPAKKYYNDEVLNWQADGKVYYMLVPYGYDAAHANTVFAKETKAQYYYVYEEIPKYLAADDQTASFSHTVNNQVVKRFILLPSRYDAVRSNTANAQYTGKYNYWTVYNCSPAKKSADDVVKSWQASVDGIVYTRYVLLPVGYSEAQLKEIMDSDTSANSVYYAVSQTSPQKNEASDSVYTFSSGGKVLYILLPANFDNVKRDTAVAKYTGNFNYYTIYSEQPTKLVSTDSVKNWQKIIDNKAETRYMLLPAGYSEDLFNSLKNEDVNGQNVYYVVSTTRPTPIQSGDTPYGWFNKKTGTYKYMLIPADPDILKINNTVYADTGVFEYYKVYSISPESGKLTPDDKVITTRDASLGTIYILVPNDYDQKKVDDAIKEVTQ